MITKESGQYLVEIAKKAILTYLDEGRKIEIPKDCPEELKKNLVFLLH